MKKNNKLEDVSKNPGATTIRALAERYQLTTTKIGQILRESEVHPIGKIPLLDKISKRPSIGKPQLAFDEAEATKAIDQITSVKTTATTTPTTETAPTAAA